MKSYRLLISRTFTFPDSLEFAVKILELVKSELSKTTDVKKITLGIDVYVLYRIVFRFDCANLFYPVLCYHV